MGEAVRLESGTLFETTILRVSGSDIMEYEVVQSAGTINEWRVEAIDHDGEGEVYVALFSGPLAKQRAEEYAAWKSAAASDRRHEQKDINQERRAYA
jgi:hypothetical protein